MLNADELDGSYTALSEAIGRVGPDKAQLFLATLSLALIVRGWDAAQIARLIEQAERLSRT